MLIVVRDGSTILFSEFGQEHTNVGDVVLLGASTLCSSELEGHVTVTTIYLDTDEARAEMLMPWLDELIALSVAGGQREQYHRIQALWFSIMNRVGPFIHVTPVRTSTSQRSRIRPTLPRGRRFVPLRAEARAAQAALRGDLAGDWTLSELSDLVHLSPKQLARVFTDAFGKTPLAYLTLLRVQQMARLLHAPDLSMTQAE